MLRRYGVMRDPALALRALACEAAIGAGQLLRDRTAAGHHRPAARLPRRRRPPAPRSRRAPRCCDLGAREALELRRRRRG